jgi:hypothetical protein
MSLGTIGLLLLFVGSVMSIAGALRIRYAANYSVRRTTVMALASLGIAIGCVFCGLDRAAAMATRGFGWLAALNYAIAAAFFYRGVRLKSAAA